MRVSRGFVKTFLLLFLVTLGLNLVAIGLKVWNQWLGWSILAFIVVLFFLIFRKHPVGFIRFLAWTLPLILVLAILYVNFLPFGFHKEYTINVLEDGKVVSSSSEIWLEDMKGKKITNLSDLYSYGSINVVVKPKVVLKNATVNVSVIGEDVYLAKLDLSNVSWDYNWDFTKGIPSPLNGTAKFNSEKGCVYFNGSNNETLYYPNSSDMFENDSFIVYVEWRPEELRENETRSQIMGHYNWELWQYSNKVRFSITTYQNESEKIYAIEKDQWLTNNLNKLLLIYELDQKDKKNYISFYLNSIFIGSQTIKDQNISIDYGNYQNLSFGKSMHGTGSYFRGCVYSAGFDYTDSLNYANRDSFNLSDKIIKISLIGLGNLESIKLRIEQ